MRSPLKLALWIGLGLLGLALVALLVAILMIDRIVKTVVEEGGSSALGTAVTLSSADVKPMAGRLELDEFAISNPPRFRAEPFLRLGRVEARWNQGSLFSDRIEIDEIAIDGVTVNLEYSDGRTNFGTILDHVTEPGSSQPSSSGGKSRSLLVRHVIVRGISASVHAPGLAESSAGVQVKDIELHDFRTDGSSSEVVGALTRTLVDAVLSSTLEAGSASFPAEILGNLKAKVESRVQDLKSQAEEVLDSVKSAGDLFKKLK